jgi:predicted adenylyl cyclase CyaB
LRVPLGPTRTARKILLRLATPVAIVKKDRALYLYRNCRIHLDRVESLGTFIEFEVPFEGNRKTARRLLTFLVERFGIAPDDVFAGAYIDLLSARLPA